MRFLAALVTAAMCAVAAARAALPAQVGYNRDIRPIFANHCFKCHGQDVRDNQSDLRLDLATAALAPHRSKTGRVSTPLVPGQPSRSELWRRVQSADPDDAMPPPAAHLDLAAGERLLLKRWIEQGARYEPHWAYLPPKKTEPPAVSTPAWARGAIDRFILAALDAQGIKPSPEADRRTLIRRLSLDLIGLPPTPAEAEAFASDSGPDAWDRLVDHLLASPHYGERMAVPWLDLARFADSVGYHGDQLEDDFPYREYVIAAFNDNKPFDRFTLEQLAGDLLPGATAEDRVATGFNRLNMMTREGGAQPSEYLAKYAADRVRTVATAWLGSSMACCECHDHKFDPFKTRDFYAMEAYFADIKQYGVYTSYKYTPEPELKGFNNDSPFPPEIEVTSAYLVARERECRDRLGRCVAAAGRTLLAERSATDGLDRWAAQVRPRLTADPGAWSGAPAVRAAGMKGVKAAVEPDGTVLISETRLTQAGGENDAMNERQLVADRFEVDVRPPPGPAACIRLEVLPDPAHGGRVTAGAMDWFMVKKLELTLARAGATKPEPIPVAAAFADGETGSRFNGEIQTNLVAGWRSLRDEVTRPRATVYFLGSPLSFEAGDTLTVAIAGVNVGRVRFSVSPIGCRLPTEPLPAAVRMAFAASTASPGQRQLLAEEYFRGTGAPQGAGFGEALDALTQAAACRGGRAYTVVTEAVAPRTTRVLPRGDWQNQTGDVVLPAVPSFLSGSGAAAAAVRQNRLDLARWLTSRNNPLTARAFVNRLWAQFFGAGLAATVDDLGTRGDYPSHPELLDWLAVEFMDSGWDVKHLVRLIVTSEAYRQSSRFRPDLEEADPRNRLLARQNARRLDAEFVRDNALFASGLIDLKIGGPSAYPYQPPGYYAALLFPTRDYAADQDERQYRRGVYLHWQRTFLHPMLANFDAPSREECTASRIESNTPQQALTLLNDPTFVEAARSLACQVLALPDAASFEAGLNEACERLLSRPPRGSERDSLRGYFADRLTYYRAHPADAVRLEHVGNFEAPASLDPAEVAAWTEVARVLINLNESIVRY